MSGRERLTPLFECLECGDQHSRKEREAHPFRPDISICPECKAKRAEVVRDFDGPVGDYRQQYVHHSGPFESEEEAREANQGVRGMVREVDGGWSVFELRYVDTD